MRPAKTHIWVAGDIAYLVPTLKTAPSEAYKTPQCVIVTIPRPGTAEYGYVELALPDGKRLWTSIKNIQLRPWKPAETDPKPTPPRRLHLNANEREITLW